MSKLILLFLRAADLSAALNLSDNKFIVMMRYKLFVFLAPAIFAAGCGGSSNLSGQNSNAAVNSANAVAISNNANTVNQPTPEPAAHNTEVPTFTEAQVALEEGKKLFAHDEDEKAVQAFEQAVKLDTNVPEAHFQLALAYDAVDNKESAEKSYNAAIKGYLKFLVKNPKDATAQFNLGRSYNKMNEDQKALKVLQQAVKLNPDDSEYHLEMGNILIKLAKYPEAIKELKKSLELDPENSRADAALERAESGNDRVKAAQAKNKDNNAKAEQGKKAVQTSKANQNTNTNSNINSNKNSGSPPSNVKIIRSLNVNR
jgi:tetratricopeptide (TPR) repeat protein